MAVIHLPPVAPARRVALELPPERRRALAQVLVNSRSLIEAADRFGTTPERLSKLANREGFHELIEPLRHPLARALRNKDGRAEFLRFVNAGWTQQQIAAHYHVSPSAIHTFLQRHRLTTQYRKMRRLKILKDRRRLDPRLVNDRMWERYHVAHLLAAHGAEVTGSPRFRNGTMYDFRLIADGTEARVLHVKPSPVGGGHYYRVMPSVSDAWYVAITPDRWVIAYAPPHDGRVRYCRTSNPARAKDNIAPPTFVCSPEEWAGGCQ